MSDLNDDAITAVRVLVSGHVQGVFFRDSTRRLARERGVNGWVRNDPEGTVSAVLEGAEADVDAVVDWMRRGGPPRAAVDQVRTSRVPPSGHDGFTVRH